MKGFVTIATGKEHYYKLAANLLLSYRYFTKNPLPFAIIAEEENQYTALFDDVIINKETTRSWLDKFDLLKLCPYDETIFLDADCLAYGDLNKFWDVFDGATDFSASGLNFEANDRENAWYNVEDLGEYGEGLTYKCRVHAALIYMKKGEKLDAVYKDCIELYHNYNKMYFHSCAGNIDECVFSVAMPRNGMKATAGGRIDLLAYLPVMSQLYANIWEEKISCKTKWGTSTETGLLCHFATQYTYKSLYRFNVEQLNVLRRYQGNKKKVSLWKRLLYQYKWRYFFLRIEDGFKAFGKGIATFFKRAFGKLSRILKRNKTEK